MYKNACQKLTMCNNYTIFDIGPHDGRSTLDANVPILQLYQVDEILDLPEMKHETL